MTPKLIIFDLDNTLVLTRPAAKVGYKQAIYYLAKSYGIYADRDKLYNHWKRLVQTVSKDKDPNKRQFSYSLKLLAFKHKIPETYLAQAIRIYDKEMLNNLQSLPGAKDVLTRLKQQQHVVAVSTASVTSEATKKLKHTLLYPLIDHLVTATDVGVMKPEINYYQPLVTSLKFKPDHVLVVGDDDREDLAPAKKLHYHTLLISGPQTHLSLLFEHFGSWLAK